VVRTSHARLLEEARASYAGVALNGKSRKMRLDVRVFGSVGAHLKMLFIVGGETVEVRSETQLAPATNRALDRSVLREHLGRLGETHFALAEIDDRALDTGLFLPIRELNRLRQQAVEQLQLRRDWARDAARAARAADIERNIAAVETITTGVPPSDAYSLSAQVFQMEDAEQAAAAGATEIVFDPFLRHPTPPVARLLALRDSLGNRGVGFRLRTPTIVRPEERRALEKWLASELPLLSGHLGLVAELSHAGRDVVADYAVNVMNQHSAARLFSLGARRIVLSVELTADEMSAVVAPWHGAGFEVLLYGRPEGMTVEHCVLSAAFDRVPTTCRDLCVKKYTNVTLTDPAGYDFAVATDSACRNRLLHSRPIEGSEYLPKLWGAGIRAFHLVFNVPTDPVAEVVSSYKRMLDSMTNEQSVTGHTEELREVLGTRFTRGHFARAV
jgi:putative protease